MKDRMKVYHGVPKSVTDENTIFYASFDGTTKSEISKGNVLNSITNPVFLSSPTGYGLVPHSTDSTGKTSIYALEGVTSNCVTVDIWLYLRGDNANGVTDVASMANSIGSPSLSSTLIVNNDRKLGIYINKNNSSKTIWTDYILPPRTHFHLRYIIKPNKIVFYVNGNQATSVSDTLIDTSNLHYAQIGSGAVNTRSNLVMASDFHISNIDRGDFFPNLPQDFIEGKAIIKERFGQQQIKGDPMINQITELRLPTWGDGSDYESANKDSDGCYQLKNNPECRLKGSNSWGYGTIIKIKGMTNEVITGALDKDTALCNITEYKAGNYTTLKVKVSDVSKINVGDSLRYVRRDLSITGGSQPTVVSVNTDQKEIELSFGTMTNLTWHVGDYFFEITESSSSPTIKAIDGRPVVGTWSGLGTNEAVFTVSSTSTALPATDLLLTYSLNIVNGNSHFSEIPYSIDKAFTEIGIEMNPVTEIIIEDDFKDKVSYSTEMCSHISKAIRSSSLADPLNNGGTEFNQTDYGRISYLNDEPLNYVQTQVSGDIPQQLFSFNIIDMVEKKLGCNIPDDNKVAWLRDNVFEVTADAWSRGTSRGANKASFNIYRTVDKWDYYPVVNTSSSIKKMSRTLNSSISLVILDDGYMHCMAHSESSDGETISSIFIDYIKLTIKLKIPSNYVALYCENKRAREDVCNPVLVQKETKVVKRYLPCKECFVTESKKGNSNSSSISANTYKIISKSDFLYATSQGTGRYKGDDHYQGSIAKLGVTPYSYDYICEDLTDNIGYIDRELKARFIKVDCVSHPVNNLDLTPIKIPNGSLISMKPFLVNRDGKLLLVLYLSEVKNGVKNRDIGFRSFNIPNRPLIK